jgi:hypothetical protein
MNSKIQMMMRGIYRPPGLLPLGRGLRPLFETGLAEIVFRQPADQYGIVEDHDVVHRFGQLMIVLSPARKIKGGVLCHRQNTVCVLISHPQTPRRHTHTLSKMFHPQHGEPLVPWHRRTVTYQ